MNDAAYAPVEYCAVDDHLRGAGFAGGGVARNLRDAFAGAAGHDRA